MPRRDAGSVWDALIAAAIAGAGRLPALDSLRIEKGYRYFGRPDGSDTPFEAGVGFCVAHGKLADARSRSASAASDARRRRQRLPHVLRRGGSSRGGAVIGRVRSAAYGFTVQKNVALAKLPARLADGDRVQVDVLGELVPGVVVADALYDPDNARIRS